MADDKLSVEPDALTQGGRGLTDLGARLEKAVRDHQARLARIEFTNPDDRVGDKLTAQFEANYQPAPINDAVAQIAADIGQYGQAAGAAAGDYSAAEQDAQKGAAH